MLSKAYETPTGPYYTSGLCRDSYTSLTHIMSSGESIHRQIRYQALAVIGTAMLTVYRWTPAVPPTVDCMTLHTSSTK